MASEPTARISVLSRSDGDTSRKMPNSVSTRSLAGHLSSANQRVSPEEQATQTRQAEMLKIVVEGEAGSAPTLRCGPFWGEVKCVLFCMKEEMLVRASLRRW